MLRTHEYEFKPGRKVFKADSIVTSEAQIPFAPKVVISSPCGSGWLRVREFGTGDPGSETGPGEFSLPYHQGTYVLDLPFRWPTSRFEVVNVPDGHEGPVRISLVRSQEPDDFQATRQTIDDTAGQNIGVGNVGASASFPTGSVIIKCSSEAAQPFCYGSQSNPVFASSPKLYPGESLPPFPVRRALNIYVRCDAGQTSIAEFIEVPTW